VSSTDATGARDYPFYGNVRPLLAEVLHAVDRLLETGEPGAGEWTHVYCDPANTLTSATLRSSTVAGAGGHTISRVSLRRIAVRTICCTTYCDGSCTNR